MMMAIAVHNRRRAILRSNTFFYLGGEEHGVVDSIKMPILFSSLHYFVHLFSGLCLISFLHRSFIILGMFSSTRLLLQFPWFSGGPMNQSLELFRRLPYTCASKSQSLSVSQPATDCLLIVSHACSKSREQKTPWGVFLTLFTTKQDSVLFSNIAGTKRAFIHGLVSAQLDHKVSSLTQWIRRKHIGRGNDSVNATQR